MSKIFPLSEPNQCQKVLKLSGESPKKSEKNISSGKDRTLSNLNDLLIVRKIPELSENQLSEDEGWNDINELVEQKLLTDEYEAIVKRQLQMLQADERGKRALSNEIAEIKKLQEKRSEVLNARKRALEKEKERSKRIAALPPPLPRSIRSLLKERDKKDLELNEKADKKNPDIQFEGLQGIAVHSRKDHILNSDSENKENMLDDNESRERKLIEAERDMKAKKRFNEALRKERVKQEYAETLRQIENAEQANRRQQAKDIVSKKGTVPCSLSDKLMSNDRQVKMEDAVENIYKRNTKEHAIEDLEGYEDHWEVKYKSIDSNLANKMIDCVPKFVKENYSYLLEDESLYQCGKRFSGLDDSSGDLNRAYIESPPQYAETSSEEIDAIISRLDKMRAETNEAYEKEFKPLLERNEDGSKPSLMDKAVETHILKQPTEDKGVENCNIPFTEKAPSSSRSVQVNLMKRGVMDFQRRDFGSKFKSYRNGNDEYLSHSKPEISEQTGPEKQWKSPHLETWSSSSYLSLPSNHGMPDICKLCDSPSCDLPIAETVTAYRDYIPLSKAPSEHSETFASKPESATILNDSKCPRNYSDSLPESDIARDRDIKEKSLPESDIARDRDIKEKSLPENKGTTIENKPRKSRFSYYVQQVADKYLKSKYKKPNTVTAPRHVSASVNTDSLNSPSQISANNERKKEDIDGLIEEKRHHLISSPSPAEPLDKQSAESSISELAAHLKQIPLESQLYKESVSVDVLFPSHHQATDEQALNSAEESLYTTPKTIISDKDKNYGIPMKQHKYHELSTITEMESALTNRSVPSFKSSLDDLSLKEKSAKNSFKNGKSAENINVSSASLIDVPPSEVSELAKSIRFIEAVPKLSTSVSVPQSMISGALTDFQTPSVLAPETPKLSPSLYLSSLSSNSKSFKHDTPQMVNSGHTLFSISADSQRTPYSSSFQDSLRKPPYLTDVESLPRYFEDVSSVRQGDKFIKYQGGFEMFPYNSNCPDTTSFNQKYPNKAHTYLFQPDNAKKPSSSPESSAASFKMASPHSYVSSSSDTNQQGVSDNNDGKIIEENRQNKKMQMKPKHSSSSSLSSLKAASPVSYLSSPSRINPLPIVTINEHLSVPTKCSQKQIPLHILTKEVKNADDVCTESVRSFTNITPHSYFSSLGSSQFHSPLKPREVHRLIAEDAQSLRKEKYSSGFNEHPQIDNNSSSVTLHTRISLPHRNQIRSPDADGQDSFEPLTPLTNFSSPTEDHITEEYLSSNVQQKTPTSAFVKLEPITLRFDNKSPSSQEHLDYHFTVGDGSHFQQGPLKNLKSSYMADFDVSTYSKIDSRKGMLNDQKSKEHLNLCFKSGAKTCASDFFVPQLNKNDFQLSKTASEQLSVNKDQKSNSEDFIPHNITENFETFKKPEKVEHLVANKKHGIELLTVQKVSETVPSNPFARKKAETIGLALEDKQFRSANYNFLTKGVHKKEHMSNISKDLLSQHPLDTPASSSEGSDIFSGSKINFQSTPIKSIEDLIKEPGILEEPDLTLFKSELTINPVSPEKTTTKSSAANTKRGSAALLLAAQSTYSTPSVLHKPFPKVTVPESTFCDSPSLRSFLGHEMSCFSDATPEVSSVSRSQTSSPKGTSESVKKKVKPLSARKTPGCEYKSRTKRLWNNLEEVKSRKLIAERKEQMTKNRMKMKAFAKKLAKPKKDEKGNVHN